MKDTALISLLGSVAGQMEVFRRAQLVGRADFRPLEAYLAAAAMYWALTSIFQYFQSRLERRLSRGYVRAAVQRKTKWVPASAAGSLGGGVVLGAAPSLECVSNDCAMVQHQLVPPVIDLKMLPELSPT